jgi:ATP synthase protein I
MPKAEDPRDEALRRLTERADALRAQTQRPVHSYAGEQAAGQAYRILAELLGGVLLGLAVGFIADRIFRTTPWGLIAGVLLGFALSIWMARRTANRLMAQARQERGAAPAVPVDDDEE